MFDPTLVGLGFAVGTLIGLTGIGGGALLTPLLILVAGVRPSIAVGTDLAFAALTKLVGAGVHLRHGSTDLKLVARLAVGSVPGALLGTRAIGLLEGTVGAGAEPLLARVIAVALILAAAASLARALGVSWSVGAATTPGPVTAPLIGLLVGFLVGLTSIGAGSILMAALALFYGLSGTRSIGTDVVHGAVLAAVAALAYGAQGRVELQVLGPLLVGSLPGVIVGGALCSRLPGRVVRLGVAGLLMVTALRLL